MNLEIKKQRGYTLKHSILIETIAEQKLLVSTYQLWDRGWMTFDF